MGRGIRPGEAHDAVDVEHTEVRARQARDAGRGVESLEAKLERAREAFAQLGDDPRARLLQVAMLRRDEVLLDALLRRLDSGQR